MKKTVFLICLLVTSLARADLGPPYLTPASPTPSDTIVLHALQDACNVLNTGLIPPQITQSGGTIDVLVTGDHESDPEFCFYGVGVADVPIGAFQPGSYTMQVTWQYPGIGGLFEERPLGELEFVVLPGEPSETIEAVPAMNTTGALLSVSMMSALVWWQRRRRDPS